VNKKYLAFIMF